MESAASVDALTDSESDSSEAVPQIKEESSLLQQEVHKSPSVVVEDETIPGSMPATEGKKLKKCTWNKTLIFSAISKASLLLTGYIISYFNWTFILVPITIVSLVWLETTKMSRSAKITSRASACSSTKNELLEKIDELPAWVTFPDRERAEWLNQIVAQFWPTINSFVIKKFRGSLQAKIRKKYPSFRFEDVDFGDSPPKIDGVKVYNRSLTKDSIMIDFDAFYDGNCEINFSLSGAQIGCIRDFQLCVTVRVVLKPLLSKMPLIGGIQVFFLNTPDIDFTLEGISGVPGLSYLIRSNIEKRIRKKIVFPNKVTKRFSKSVEAAELKSLEPEGVLRVHVTEARNLERMDVTGKSDPYVILTVGAQEYKTPVVKRSLNPKWDYWCEFIILDPMSQQLKFRMFDQDDLNEDDFMGSGVIDLCSVVGEGQNDQWIELEGAKHGQVHLRFTWLSLTSNYEALELALKEAKVLKVSTTASALLTVYVDSAQNLPRTKSLKKPDPYLIMMVGPLPFQQQSKVKRFTTDPVWEQGFSLLVRNPEEDLFYATIMDKHDHNKIDQIAYKVSELIEQENMEVSKIDIPLPKVPNGKLTISLQLRILRKEEFRSDDSSDTSSEDELSRETSTKSGKSSLSPQISSNIEEDSIKVRTPLVSSTPVATSKVATSQAATSKAKLLTQRTPSSNSSSIDGASLGRIELSMEYSEPRQKLLITVHKLVNLPIKDPKDIPDPYVKLKLVSPLGTIRYKTKTVIDDCDPVFGEVFDFLVSPPELSDQTLIITAKTKKKLFQNNFLGQVVIKLKYLDFREPFRKWYDLQKEEYSD